MRFLTLLKKVCCRNYRNPHFRRLNSYQKIIKENPHTEIAAVAHFDLADIYRSQGNGAKTLQEYQTLIDEYKGTSFGYTAESFLIDCRYQKSNDSWLIKTWLQKKNEQIMRYGGVSIFDVIKSKPDMDEHQNECNDDKITDKCGDNNGIDNDRWWKKLQAMTPEFRNAGIPSDYSDIASFFNDQDKTDDALKLLCFVRTYFPNYVGTSEEIRSIKRILLFKKGITDWSRLPKDTTPPVIRRITPDGEHTICNGRPQIEVEINDGDISQTQIDLSKLVFTLDGQNLNDLMRVKIRINTSARLGYVFERIRLIYRPESPLSHGTHTAYIKVQDRKGQSSEKTWTLLTR